MFDCMPQSIAPLQMGKRTQTIRTGEGGGGAITIVLLFGNRYCLGNVYHSFWSHGKDKGKATRLIVRDGHRLVVRYFAQWPGQHGDERMLSSPHWPVFWLLD